MAVESMGYRKGAIAISAGLGVALPLVSICRDSAVRWGQRGDSLRYLAACRRLARWSRPARHIRPPYGCPRGASRRRTGRSRSIQVRVCRCPFGCLHACLARCFSPAWSSGGRSATPDGVPVISRAVDALDEAEAWAEIDAMFSGDSPFSCDPTRSKDMYQIALEELHRTEQAAAQAAARSATAAADAREDVIGRDEAMASLYGGAVARASYAPSASQDATRFAPVSAAPVRPVAVAATVEDVEVPMADYSGHEDMWAALSPFWPRTRHPRPSGRPDGQRWRGPHGGACRGRQ
ncbi:MAG: hypothetical protein ACLTSX_01700 [Collinsella sp.]